MRRRPSVPTSRACGPWPCCSWSSTTPGLGPFHGGFIGVDVFFVISGFLITGLLLNEAARSRDGSPWWPSTPAGRRRILPAATLVLLVTVAVGYVVLPGIDLLRLLTTTVWAAFFAANVKLARDATDYWAQDDATSPIQHYWSLAVEEQFYLVWPVLVLVLVLLVGRRGRTRRAVVTTLTVVSAISLAWAVHLSSADAGAAYFSTPARAWELGAGAATAALMSRAGRLPLRLLAAASGVGVLLVLGAALTFGPRTGVPGLPTLLPVLGTCLLLAGGARGAASPVQDLLGTGVMRWIGDRSYSFYLWHWPALVFAGVLWGPVQGWRGALVALAALGVSDLSYRYVENPFRTARWVRPRVRGILLYPASVGVLGLTVLSAHTAVVHQFDRPSPAISASNYGQSGAGRHLSKDPRTALVEASVLAARNAMAIPNPLKPQALGLADHVAADLGACEYYGMPDPMPLCPRGDPQGTRTIVLVGDSHMRHWIPAVDPIARRAGYRAFYFVYQGCTPALVEPVSPVTDAPDTNCDAFHAWSEQQIARLHPDVVLMSTDTQREYVDASGTRVSDNQAVASLIEQGMEDRIRSVQQHAGRVVVLADPPRLRFNPTEMFERGSTLADGLSRPQPRQLMMRHAVKDAAAATGAGFVETRQWFCAYDECPVIIGDWITRRDRGHMTLEYSASLSGVLAPRLGLGSPPTR